MKAIDYGRAAVGVVGHQHPVNAALFTARYGRLCREGRASLKEGIGDWNSWVQYLTKLKSQQQVSLNTYSVLTNRTNNISSSLSEYLEAIAEPCDLDVHPFLNEGKTDLKEIVITTASDGANGMPGPPTPVARFYQVSGRWEYRQEPNAIQLLQAAKQH
jgi:hypothetical protein